MPLHENKAPPRGRRGTRDRLTLLPDDEAINNFTILNLFGKDRLEAIQATVAKATGLALVTLDYKGEPVTEMTGFTSFCREMRHKECSAGLCRSSDVYGAGQALAGQRQFVYFCPHGLLEVAIPIIVKGHYLGGFYGGQVRCENAPDDIPRLSKLFEGKLQACPLTERQKKFYKNIPVYDFTSFRHITELIALMISQIGERETVTRGMAQNSGNESGCSHERVKYLEAELSRKRREIVNLLARQDYHFLIGSLTAVANLASIENAPRANEMALLIAEHLKYGSSRENPFVLLSEEITDVERYLKMQKIRFGDLLRYTADVPKDVAARRVPLHSVLAFVEYAVFYGLNTRDAELNVSLSATIEGERLVVVIADDGPGLTEEELNARFALFKRGYEGESIQMNLAATRSRLFDLFGNDCEVSVSAVAGDGTKSVIKIPAHISFGGF